MNTRPVPKEARHEGKGKKRNTEIMRLGFFFFIFLILSERINIWIYITFTFLSKIKSCAAKAVRSVFLSPVAGGD